MDLVITPQIYVCACQRALVNAILSTSRRREKTPTAKHKSELSITIFVISAEAEIKRKDQKPLSSQDFFRGMGGFASSEVASSRLYHSTGCWGFCFVDVAPLAIPKFQPLEYENYFDIPRSLTSPSESIIWVILKRPRGGLVTRKE